MDSSSRPSDFHEANSRDFQFALEKLIAAYQPVIEEELNQLKSPPASGAASAAPSRTAEEENAISEAHLRIVHDR